MIEIDYFRASYTHNLMVVIVVVDVMVMVTVVVNMKTDCGECVTDQPDRLTIRCTEISYDTKY